MLANPHATSIREWLRATTLRDNFQHISHNARHPSILFQPGDADAMTPQIISDFATAIGLVAHPSAWTLLRPTASPSFHRTTGHHGFEPQGFAALSRAQHEGHQDAVDDPSMVRSRATGFRFLGESSGWSRSHCVSVSSLRFILASVTRHPEFANTP